MIFRQKCLRIVETLRRSVFDKDRFQTENNVCFGGLGSGENTIDSPINQFYDKFNVHKNFWVNFC